MNGGNTKPLAWGSKPEATKNHESSPGSNNSSTDKGSTSLFANGSKGPAMSASPFSKPSAPATGSGFLGGGQPSADKPLSQVSGSLFASKPAGPTPSSGSLFAGGAPQASAGSLFGSNPPSDVKQNPFSQSS